jgi:transcriptional regulator with XRE-family HTH domain
MLMIKRGETIALNRLAEVLKKKGITQYRLHKDSGISYALINGYYSNKKQPGLDQLHRIAQTLQVPGKDLINF